MSLELKTHEVVKLGRVNQLSIIWRRYKRNKIAVLGIGIVAAFMVMAILAPIISPHDPFKIVMFNQYEPPNSVYLLGTDSLGRDVLSRIIYGSRVSLMVGLGAAGIAAAIGIFYGAISGFYGRKIDFVMMRVVDIFLVTPHFFLYILVTSLLRERGPHIIMVMLGFLMWPRLARIVRGEFLSLKERYYVVAARNLGCSNRRLIFKHILPNAMAPVIVTATMSISAAILVEASLTFLGLGDPTAVSWGVMLTRGRDVLKFAWWLATFPGLAIFLLSVGFNLVGDGLRDSLDPRLKM